MMDAYTQTLQDQIGQLSKLLGVQQQQGQAQLVNTPSSSVSQYDLVTGLDGAKAFMDKMLNGSKHIVWDSEKPVFYVLQKDSNGSAQRIQICTFTMELEPTMEEKYVTREDFNSLVAKLDQLIQSKETRPVAKNKEVTSNG